MSRPRLSVTQTQRLQLTPGLQTSIHLLRADAAGLTRYLEEQAESNPHLRLDPAPAPAMGDWLPRWTGVIGPGAGGGRSGASRAQGAGSRGFGSQESGSQGFGLALDQAEAPSASLMAHVLGAIERMRLPPREAKVAAALADALEPSGWLGRSLTQIARDLGVPAAEIAPVLARLQRIEPAGLFARNLAECLALQLAETGALDDKMQVILERLDLLGAGDLARLARLARTTPAEISARFRIIRSLDPKPGAQFAPLAAASGALREPDLLVRRTPAGGWEVSLNHSSLPAVSVSVAGRGDVGGHTGGDTGGGLNKAGHPDAGRSGSDLAAEVTPDLTANLTAARAVARLVQTRNDTLLRVGREVLHRQSAALDHGPGALVAMTMADVAEVLGLHESTVSRVVAGASVDTPRGTWWLRRLFSARVGAGAGQASGAAVQARLAQLLASESKAAPLSDAALVAALAEGGIAVARRTVAKYRAAMGIPPAARRKSRIAAGKPARAGAGAKRGA